jgi:hypothetical protein
LSTAVYDSYQDSPPELIIVEGDCISDYGDSREESEVQDSGNSAKIEIQDGGIHAKIESQNEKLDEGNVPILAADPVSTVDPPSREDSMAPEELATKPAGKLIDFLFRADMIRVGI